MKMEDKDRFFEVMKGVPAGFIVTALDGLDTGGVDFRGCGKKDILEGLFIKNPWNQEPSKILNDLPSLEQLRDTALACQKRAKETTEANRKREADYMARQINKPAFKKRNRQYFGIGYQDLSVRNGCLWL
jgi:hypothetical protein